MNTRIVCRVLAIGVLASLWAPPVQAQVEARVREGVLSGIRLPEGSVSVYKGIPYAAAPVGPLRWQTPQPPEGWEGVRSAKEFAAACPQNLARSRNPWTGEFMVQHEADEDCLYLNIWTAARTENEKRPVLVYLHGGGFGEGSGSVQVYDGEQLARKGLVVATINYRLGVLGFLAHPELTAASEHGASGNYGLLDQAAALQWIRENIAAFGGDPDNVTIAGQSAGAVSVYLLTASPLAKGLFHRAIAQSGPGGLASFGLTSTRSMSRNLAEAEAEGLAFAQRKGARSIRELRALPVDTLLAALPPGSPPTRFIPIVDGYFLPDAVHAIYARGEQNDTPMLTGMNADEGSAFPGYGGMTVAAFREMVKERYGEQAETFLKLYPADTDQEAMRAHQAGLRDLALVALARLAAERAGTTRTDAYLYYFERAIPWPEHPEFGAFHTSEVPYVFNNLDLLDRPWEAVDRELADAMSSYWVNFAAAGNPNGPDLPVWPPYSRERQVLMALGKRIEPRVMPDEARRAFYEAYLSGQPDR